MSTRANIIIKDESQKLYFYRHSDGYPECTGEDLKKFCEDYTNGLMRRDTMQSAGWLILRGWREYNLENSLAGRLCDPIGVPKKEGGYGWKVGAYEPTTCIYGSIEYLYIIDLKKGVLSCRQPRGVHFWDKPTIAQTKIMWEHRFMEEMANGDY